MQTKTSFGKLPDGREAFLYTLTNRHGASLKFSDYGGIVTSLEAPDRQGKRQDVVLGHEHLAGYMPNPQYLGCAVGRVGNRIGRARFVLEGREYQLAANEGGVNHLHGGKLGFDKRLWTVEKVEHKEGPAMKLSYHSPDGEEGYPGALNVEALYLWTDNHEFRIEYSAATDKTTVVNLTHHSYFNLKDGGASSIEGHEMRIPASRITAVDAGSIPTGELRDVSGSPFDFRQSSVIGSRIGEKDEQLSYGKGYDHNWVLDEAGSGLKLAAAVYEPQSGRVMEVFTTEPATQFYSGNNLDGSIVGKNGLSYGKRHGLCLEPQRFPDSPNHPAFPSIVLKPGERYQHTLAYRFSTR
jgi:aldose 1-epimerase